MTDAIQTDAPAAVTTAPLPDLNDPSIRMSRSDAMAVMQARRRETVADDMGPAERAQFLASAPAAKATTTSEDDDSESVAADVERARLERDAATAKTESIDTASQVDRQRGETTVLNDEDLNRYQIRTKVNGREELMPLDRVRTGYQKTEAADAYLRQASELLNTVKTTLAQEASARAATGTTIADSATAPASADDEKVIAEAMDDLYQGNSDAAAKKFASVIAGRSNATPGADADQIAGLVQARIVKDSALRQFRKDHKDILADPTLVRVAETFLLEETGGADLETLPLDRIPDAVEAAGRRTAEWVKKVSGVTTPTARATPSRDEKRAAKELIDELPAASTRAASTVAGPKSVSDKIAEMAAARGQQIR